MNSAGAIVWVALARGLREAFGPWRNWALLLLLFGLVAIVAPVFEAPDELEMQVQLIASARDGNLERIERAVREGTSTELRDTAGLTPLMLAADAGQTEAVRTLIHLGADVDAYSERCGSALMLACRNGHVEIVRLLLDAGANSAVVDEKGNTAMTFAVKHRDATLVNLLQCERFVQRRIRTNGRPAMMMP